MAQSISVSSQPATSQVSTGMRFAALVQNLATLTLLLLALPINATIVLVSLLLKVSGCAELFVSLLTRGEAISKSCDEPHPTGECFVSLSRTLRVNVPLAMTNAQLILPKYLLT